MDIENGLFFSDREQWQQWLEDYHDHVSEAWLVHYKKHTGHKGLSYDEALDEALCFGWIDGKMKRLDDERFILRYSPRKAKSLWSQRNKLKAMHLIDSGRMTAAGMASIEAAKRNGLWDAAYTSRKSDTLPEDLAEALKADRAAWDNFQAFANSYRNTYIGWVNDARRDATRRRRINAVVERSRLNRKPGIA